MTALQARLARCPEATCVRRGAHDIHHDGKGRSWAFRDVPEARWVTLARLHELRAKELV